MKYIDHHVHTRYSFDSEASIEEYLINGKRMGLQYIIFTDHQDFGTNEKNFVPLIDYGEYIHTMEKLEKEYQLPINIGVEIGYEKDHKGEIRSFLNKYPIDFVIASIHYGDGGDFYEGSFFNGMNRRESYGRYFELVLEMVENFHDYDVVGHLDYITRYGPFKNRYYEYQEYKDIIDRILKAIIKNNKGIEVNTSGLREKEGRLYPKVELLERYKELGGRVITIGSDAHSSEGYYAGLKEAKGLLKSLGYNKIYYFENRIGITIDI